MIWLLTSNMPEVNELLLPIVYQFWILKGYIYKFNIVQCIALLSQLNQKKTSNLTWANQDISPEI